MTQHPTAITPEGWHVGGGFAEWMHGVGHGPLDEPTRIPVPGYPDLLCDANCPDCHGSGEYLEQYDYGQAESLSCRCVTRAADDYDDTPTVCQHGRDDYCRPCLVRERADERELGLDGGRFGWAARDGMLARLAE